MHDYGEKTHAQDIMDVLNPRYFLPADRRLWLDLCIAVKLI